MITTPHFKPKKKTTCKFKRRPKARENAKSFTYGKVRKDGVKKNCSNCGGEGHNKTTCTQTPSKLKVNKKIFDIVCYFHDQLFTYDY